MIVWKYFPCAEGGAERQCRKLVAELSGRGLPCMVLTAYLYTSLKTVETMPDGSQLRRLGNLAWIEFFFKKKLRKLRRILSAGKNECANDAVEFWLALPFVWLSRLSFMISLRRFLKKHHKNIDILHVHEAHWIAGAAAWAARGLGLTVVCKEATFPAAKKISYDVPLRNTLTKCRNDVYYIAITESIRKSLIKNGFSEERITYIPNGVELPSETAEIVSSKQAVYIGNFTQGNRQKAFDVLFEAWVIVQERLKGQIRLVVLGDGDPGAWESYLKQNGSLGSVDFVGAVPDVSPYLKKARLFILPSRVEGLSNALLEAMSWGLPVVISNIETHRNLVQHRQNGLVVPVGRSEELANAIIELQRDDVLALRLGASARETIEEAYSIEHVSDLVLGYYRTLLRRENHSRGV
jgi:glycosyltransferase involved in cell wall biosynthesis